MINLKLAAGSVFPPVLATYLHTRIKRVIDQPLALTDWQGRIVVGREDFSGVRSFQFDTNPSIDTVSVAVRGFPELVGIPLFWEKKPLVIAITPLKESEQHLNTTISSLAELLIQQFIQEHRPKPDAIDLLFSRIVHRPSSLDREELDYQLAALGYQSELASCALIVELENFSLSYLEDANSLIAEKGNIISKKRKDIEAAISGFFTKNQNNLIGYIGKDHFLVIKDLSQGDYERFKTLLVRHYKEVTRPLQNIKIKNVTIGLGTLSVSLKDLTASAQAAWQSLMIGRKIFGPGRVYAYDSLGILPVLLGPPAEEKLAVAHRLLDELQEADLIETMQAFLAADLNLTKTAERLAVHRNTIIYRLNRIEEITGKDPRCLSNAVELHLADLFLRFYQ